MFVVGVFVLYMVFVGLCDECVCEVVLLCVFGVLCV